MKYSGFLLFVLLAFGALESGALVEIHHRWSIKTSANLNQSVHAVNYPDLISLKNRPDVKENDPRYDNALIPAFDNPLRVKEGDLVSFTGYLHLVAREKEDGDYHIQVSNSVTDGNDCIIVEIPDPTNVADTELKSRCTAERDWVNQKLLRGNMPSQTGNVMMHPPKVQVTGQLFLDLSHLDNNNRGKKEMHSATLWELHPVTAMIFVK